MAEKAKYEQIGDNYKDIFGRNQAEKIPENSNRELLESEKKYEDLVKNNHDIIYSLDSQGKFISVSPAWTRLLGHPVDEIENHLFQPFVHPDDLESCMAYFQKVIFLKQSQSNVEYRVANKDGSWQWFSSSAVARMNEFGEVVGFNGIARDVTEHKLLEESGKINSAIVAALPDLLFRFSKEGVFLDCQSNEANPLLIEKELFIGKKLNEVLPPTIAEQGFHAITKAIDYSEVQTFEYELDLLKGRQFFEMRITPINPNQCIGLGRNITKEKELEQELIDKSLYDEMTGLYSRNHMEEQLGILKNSRQYPITFINIDVNGLKIVNDTFGHLEGDKLLIKVGKVLKSVFRSEDCVCRAGGDEFIIILPETSEETTKDIVKRIKNSVNIKNTEDTSLILSIAIGTATAKDKTKFDEAYKKSDEKMYEDKNKEKIISRFGRFVKFIFKKNKPKLY